MLWAALVYTVIVTGSMIGFGYLFMKKPPQEINSVFGYRTRMSSQNKETWRFAHTYAGRFWVADGWITLVVSLLCLLITYRTSVFLTVVIVLLFAQLTALLLVIPFTEAALRRAFDRNGRPRE